MNSRKSLLGMIATEARYGIEGVTGGCRDYTRILEDAPRYDSSSGGPQGKPKLPELPTLNYHFESMPLTTK
jgi:hypothetical protein